MSRAELGIRCNENIAMIINKIEEISSRFASVSEAMIAAKTIEELLAEAIYIDEMFDDLVMAIVTHISDYRRAFQAADAHNAFKCYALILHRQLIELSNCAPRCGPYNPNILSTITPALIGSRHLHVAIMLHQLQHQIIIMDTELANE